MSRPAGTQPARPAASDAWSPLRLEPFRWLWTGVLVSNIGVWMQTVGAQWLVVDAPNAATLVSLVQTATALPVTLLALPAGVLADSFDRRKLLIAVQVYLFAVAGVLAILTAAHQMSPGLLLAFTFGLGAGAALQAPGWQAVIPEVVPRAQLKSAAALGSMSINLGRAIGPALAGIVIAGLGVPAVFALNAISVVFFGVALAAWRRPDDATESHRERFLPALRAGGRYVRHAPVVRRVLFRGALFIVPAMALWALLPLVASERLHLGAGGYGLLLGALGAGAVLGVFALAPVRSRLSSDRVLLVASIVYALATMVVILVATVAAVIAALVVAGLAWLAVLSTLNAELQLFVPVWVRARGLGVYMIVLYGSQAAGALVWGLIAQRAGLLPAFLAAAIVMAVGIAAGAARPLIETGNVDRSPAVYWPEARLAFDPEPDAGPVVVTVEYTVAPDREAAFLDAMARLRRSRQRTGATRWQLCRDGERSDRFVELFSVPSWDEHLRQHDGRMTGADRESDETAKALSDPPPRIRHLLPPETVQ